MLGIFRGMFDTVSGSDENWKSGNLRKRERMLCVMLTKKA